MTGTIYLLHFDQAYQHARHYTGKPESSQFLKGHGRVHGCEFAELGLWQPASGDCDIRSARQSADPQPVTVWVAKFKLAPVRRLTVGSTELGHDRVDVAHEQMDQGVGPGIALVLGQEQPRPLARDRDERGAAGLEAMFPLLGEAQALIPADRRVGVGHAQDRDDFRLHAGMISRPAARRVQQSGVFAGKADRRSGIARTLQQSGKGPDAHQIDHLICDKQRPYPVKARTNCRQVQHWTTDLAQRLDEHRHGRGARLIDVITTAGIGFRLARTRPGHRGDERAIKRSGAATRHCPLCTPRPRQGRWSP